MNISKNEAEQSLAEIQKVADQTRRALASGSSAPLLMLWGAIWVIGYSAGHFFPMRSGAVWLPLSIVGGLLSWYLSVKCQSPLKSPHDAKIGFFWLTLFIYAALWSFLLKPASPERFGAYMATIPMFAYIVGGIWLGRFFIYLGVIVTILTVAGLMLVPQIFGLWMAVTGGGSLMLAGVYMRRYWR